MKRIWALSALGLLSATALGVSPALAQLSINISVNVAPPALPIYDQPPIPAPDAIWVPGYWAWDDYVQDYYWIPGTWVMAPRPGLLWTPPWWGWQDGAFLFHAGYWGPHVGFYGGVSYGFGYSGAGYQGAYWNGGHVFYNRSVTNITNVNVTNVYNKTVIVNRVTNVSYNGGPGGVQARPSPAEKAAMREPHIAPTALQQQHYQAARANKQLFASANHGRPPIAAAARPAQFAGGGVVPTRQAAPYHPSVAPHAMLPHQPSAPGAAASTSAAPSSPGGHPEQSIRQPAAVPTRPEPAAVRASAVEAARPPAADGGFDRAQHDGQADRPERPAPYEEQGDQPPHMPHPEQTPRPDYQPPRPQPVPHAQPRPPHPQPPSRPHPQNGGHPKPPRKDEHH